MSLGVMNCLKHMLLITGSILLFLIVIIQNDDFFWRETVIVDIHGKSVIIFLKEVNEVLNLMTCIF